MAIEEKVKKIVLAIMDVKEEEIVPSAHLIDDLDVTSVDMVEILTDIENEFNIEIPEVDVDDIRTIQDIIDYLENKTKG